MNVDPHVCVDCQTPFVIENGERDFFESRGLPLPRRCVDCRRRRRATRPAGSGRVGPIRQYGSDAAPNPTRRRSPGGGAPSGFAAHDGAAFESNRAKRARPRWEIVCSECGRADTMPFEPKPGVPIFCRDCHRARKAGDGTGARASGGGAAPRSGDGAFPSDTGLDYSPRLSSGPDGPQDGAGGA